MPIIQVTGTGFDTNVFGLIPDTDGVTCWAFQDQAGAGTNRYARFSLVDGSIVHAGVTFGNSFPSAQLLQLRTDASVFWAQDNGQYYTLSLNPSNSNHLTLYKFHIAASAGGSTEVLGTYSTTTASFDLHTIVPLSGFATNLVAWTQGSNHYVAVQSTSTATTVVFDDTLTLIGKHTGTADVSGQAIFPDKNGDLWMTSWATPNLSLTFWHPADGATAFVLNSTDTLIPNSTTGFSLTGGNYPAFVHYVPSNHSVMLGDFGTTFPQYSTNLSNVLLGTPGNAGTFTQTHFRANDGSFFLNMIASGSPYDCTDLEMTVTQPSGKLAIQSDTTGPEFNTQVGGLFNLIDPINLTSYGGIYPYDVTQAIVGAAVPAPPQESYSDHGTIGLHYNAFGNMVYSETHDSLAVTYSHLDYQTGSALYLVSFGAAAPTVTSIAPSSGVIAGGTPVTITGTNFVNGATVTIGGLSATSVVFVSSVSITAVTPAHAAGAVNVVVTNPDTQFATLVNGFTYVAVAVSVTPTNASIPLGGTQQFTAMVTGTLNTNVVWSVDGGTISNTGLFTAPGFIAGISATTNAAYTNRIQFSIGPPSSIFHVTATSVADPTKFDTVSLSAATAVGPFTQNGPLATFDPRRDLDVYIDGVRSVVQTFSFDALNNRYLLFMSSEFNLQAVIQIVHHMPSPFFVDAMSAGVSGFAMRAGFSPLSDPGFGLYWGQFWGLGN